MASEVCFDLLRGAFVFRATLDDINVKVARRINVAVKGDVVFLVLVFHWVLIAVADVDTDAKATFLLNMTIEFEGAVKDIG